MAFDAAFATRYMFSFASSVVMARGVEALPFNEIEEESEEEKDGWVPMVFDWLQGGTQWSQLTVSKRSFGINCISNRIRCKYQVSSQLLICSNSN